jgi:hypothetical protein
LTTTIVSGRATPPSTEELRRLAGRIRAAATARDIQQVRVVGSVARGTARPESDVDLMVTVSPDLKGAAYSRRSMNSGKRAWALCGGPWMSSMRRASRISGLARNGCDSALGGLKDTDRSETTWTVVIRVI